MKKYVLCFVLSLIIVLPAAGHSVVWKVSTDSTEMYIGGTIHILRDSDYPLPTAFDEAYDASDLLVFEVDVEDLGDPEVQKTIMSKGAYPEGQSLDQVLSEEAYKELEEHCTSLGLPMEAINRYKPSLVMLTLVSLELQKLGVTQQGVDIHYAMLAGQEQKEIEGLETIEEQIEMLTTMGDGNEDNFIIYTIRDMEKIGEMMDSMIVAWRKSDLDVLANLLNSDLKEKFPDLYQTIIYDRNANWMDNIEAYLATPATEYVLVGTAHLVGEGGVIEMLRDRGYEVEQIDAAGKTE